MSFQSLAHMFRGNWSDRPRTGGSRRRFGLDHRLAALEMLEPRMLLSAVGGTGVHSDLDHAKEQICEMPAEPRHNALAAAMATSQAPLFELDDTFFLNSDPNANHTVYLDFNGQVTTGTRWNGGATINSPAWTLDSDNSTFSTLELETIQRMWARVVEDFAPFNVNITTQEPDIERLRNTGGTDTQWGMRVIITPDQSWRGGNVGGVAYLYSFNRADDEPCWVFNVGENGAAEAISHEVGHTLGLSHDGRFPNETYYGGHGSGETGWSPIMGVGYYESISQWSRGEYPNANQSQDDLNIITNPNVNGWQGLTYRTDDHSDFPVGATNLVGDGTGAVVGEGLIERRSDQDTFQFTTAAGSITIDVSPWMTRPNLDIQVELLNSLGQVLVIANPVSALNASFTRILAAGTYYLRIDGVGKQAIGTDYGYSDYGSLGQYSIRVSTTSVREDFYEANNSRPAAADPLENGGQWEGAALSAIKGFGVAADEDWYEIFVPNGELFLTADLTFRHSDGDLTFQLVDSRGRIVQTAASQNDNERIQVLLPTDGVYYLRVANYPVHQGNFYDLKWTSIAEPLRVTSILFGYGNNRWVGGGQLNGRDAPWAVRQIAIGFNRDALVDIADLRGVTDFGSNLRFASFYYDRTRFVAVWTLADPIERDRITFTLDGDGTSDDNSDGIRVANGNNYLYEGDFDLVLNVLEGDVNGDNIVDNEDQIIIRDRRQTAYMWADVNGDGIVDIADALLTQSREGWTL